MNIHVLQHVPHEGPGVIHEWAKENDYELQIYPVYLDDPVWPEIKSRDVLVVMGGPMNIYEEEKYPWLIAEKSLIRAAVAEGRKTLGICLGAQLIADVIGGKVVKNGHTEIGWHPIRWTKKALSYPVFSYSPEEMLVYHWHGDRFDLPDNAELLAGSIGCSHQAFRYEDHVIGFQFHAEMRKEDAQRLIENSRSELISGTFIQTEEQMLAKPEWFEHSNKWLKQFLNGYLK